MKLPAALEFLRETRAWQSVRDWRYVRRHRARREFYRQFIAPGSLVFDIGANIGNYSLLFERLGARIIAVEPQAALAARLSRRFASNPRMHVVRTALGASASMAVLHKAPGLSEIASLRPDVSERSRFAREHEFSETESVPVTTLDLLVTQHGTPAFCKIDVEGFEREVLAGLTRPLPLLSLEFNREFWRETRQCLDRLVELGDYRFNYALGDTPALARAEWTDASELTTELEANRDPLLWGDVYARLS